MCFEHFNCYKKKIIRKDLHDSSSYMAKKVRWQHRLAEECVCRVSELYRCVRRKNMANSEQSCRFIDTYMRAIVWVGHATLPNWFSISSCSPSCSETSAINSIFLFYFIGNPTFNIHQFITCNLKLHVLVFHQRKLELSRRKK